MAHPTRQTDASPSRVFNHFNHGRELGIDFLGFRARGKFAPDTTGEGV